MATNRITPVDLVTESAFSATFSKIGLREPALTRLEPQSVSGDPEPGALAGIADPLWLVGRQWQLGELLGEDVGSPVSVEVTSRALPVTAWAPAGRTDGTDAPVADPGWRAWPEGAVLDELVEHVPRSASERGLRWRSETGEALADLLREAGQDTAAALLLTEHPLTLPADPSDPDGRFDTNAERLLTLLAGRVPDGAAAREALEAGTPAWVTGADDPDLAADAAARWLAWVSGAAGAGGAWTTSRLEHRFLLRFGHGADGDSAVLRADGFGAGSARWHHFEWLQGQQVDVDGDADLEDPVTTTDVMLATPLRYPAMPADRYWQLEDAAVDVAAIEAQPHDLARLCLAEFALVSGDDWLVVPVDGKVGALNQVLSVRVRTTFGETVAVDEDAAGRAARGFRMYEVTSPTGATLPGVVLPPVAHTPMLGDPVVAVAVLGDVAANVAWAVERVVPGRRGARRLRSCEPPPQRPAPPDDLAEGDAFYELAVPVPDSWIPLVPVSTGYAQVALRKGAMIKDGEPVLPAGLLLAPTPLTFPQEEIPREGVTVRAVPALARRRDGSYTRWVGHRIRVGRGEGSSGFASDDARDPRGG